MYRTLKFNDIWCCVWLLLDSAEFMVNIKDMFYIYNYHAMTDTKYAEIGEPT